ncbi:MAG: hypothetical protein NTY07_18560 [Bacteroidia bacterium]|nr:hypothetical protein [Bacteroidia bacterium]
MILIISDKNDKHADRVESILQKNAAEYARLNLDIDSLKSTQVKLEDHSFRIEGPNCSFSTSEIETVWNRSVRIKQLIEDNCPQNEDYLIWKDVWNKALEKLFSLLESTKWLNFYHDFYAETQFGQYVISKNIGLKWPSYICSNDINYLNSFFENKKERILKLMDQDCKMRSAGDCIGKCGDMFGSAKTDEMPENDCLIAGASYKVRCTVVGKEYFVGKIKANNSNKGQNTKTGQTNYSVVQPPKAIQMKAIQIMTELNLTHGIFDFIVTDNDNWFFDSLNPTGQYEWIEDINGSDISSSIAKWLMINN